MTELELKLSLPDQLAATGLLGALTALIGP